MDEYKVKYINISIEMETIEGDNVKDVVRKFYTRHPKNQKDRLINILNIISPQKSEPSQESEPGIKPAKIKGYNTSKLPTTVSKSVNVESASNTDDKELPSSNIEEEVKSEEQLIEFGDFVLDTKFRRLSVGDNQVTLTSREYEILAYLLKHPRPCSSKEIMIEVYKVPVNTDYDRKAVAANVSRIRKKFRRLNSAYEPVHLSKSGYCIMERD